MKEKIRIGCGAGFSGDRLEPAVVLLEKGQLDYLILECLAERTIALAQKRKLEDPDKGYDPLLERRMELLLPLLANNQTRLITNMGAANPLAAARKTQEIAKKIGLSVKIAAVYGDDLLNDILPQLRSGVFEVIESNIPQSALQQAVSANAYMGTEGILEALHTGCQVIITGRVADPSLFLAPMMHEFGWPQDDYDLLGKGTVTGHLLECAGHITGGYFADPLKKPVEGMDQLGHPFADVFADGSSIISKVAHTGGIVSLQTAKEQLLYEVINPFEYYTPDVVADFSSVRFWQLGKDQVQVSGGAGKKKPDTFKVSVGYKAFFLGEGEISYAGPGALERAQMAGNILEKRLKGQFETLRIDYIGLSAVHQSDFGHHQQPYEIRLRAAAKAQTAAKASLIGEEVEALYTNGPAGGGGVRKYTNEVIGIASVLIDRTLAQHKLVFFES